MAWRSDYGVSPPPAPVGRNHSAHDAASIALARRLQHEANVRAMREYEDHLFALEFARDHDLDVPSPPPPAHGTLFQELLAMQTHHDGLLALEFGREHHVDAPRGSPVAAPSSPAGGTLLQELWALQAHQGHLLALQYDRDRHVDGAMPLSPARSDDDGYHGLHEPRSPTFGLGFGVGVGYEDREFPGIMAAAEPGAMPLGDLAAVDPDNMTYEQLLELSEQVGDVKRERWREVSMEVISQLPSRRWTTQSREGVACVVCQSGYVVGDVSVTLPCAHVFHGDCLSGWARDNNSCPLCKHELAKIS